jgi:hypothetical protein
MLEFYLLVVFLQKRRRRISVAGDEVAVRTVDRIAGDHLEDGHALKAYYRYALNGVELYVDSLVCFMFIFSILPTLCVQAPAHPVSAVDRAGQPTGGGEGQGRWRCGWGIWGRDPRGELFLWAQRRWRRQCSGGAADFGAGLRPRAAAEQQRQ